MQLASPIIEEIVEEGEEGEEPMEVERAIEPYTNSQVAEEPIGSAQQVSARFHSLTQRNKEWGYMIYTYIRKI